MKRGEVRWYQFSPPDKKRPVVILTRDSALEFLGEVTVAPITTTIRDIPTEVLLTKADGMLRDCAVNRFERQNRISDRDAKREQDATNATECTFRSGFLGIQRNSYGLFGQSGMIPLPQGFEGQRAKLS